jgi:hypothetical protein
MKSVNKSFNFVGLLIIVKNNKNRRKMRKKNNRKDEEEEDKEKHGDLLSMAYIQAGLKI